MGTHHPNRLEWLWLGCAGTVVLIALAAVLWFVWIVFL